MMMNVIVVSIVIDGVINVMVFPTVSEWKQLLIVASLWRGSRC